MELGEYCRQHRTTELHCTLARASELTGVKLQTLAAFEQGRSTNMGHLIAYLSMGDEHQKDKFLDGLTVILKDMAHGH